MILGYEVRQDPRRCRLQQELHEAEQQLERAKAIIKRAAASQDAAIAKAVRIRLELAEG